MRGKGGNYFPIQRREKIASRIASLAVSPVISPIATSAARVHGDEVERHAGGEGVGGEAVDWTRVRYGRGALRFVVPVAGWALAVAQHSLWNLGTTTLTGASGVSSPLLGVVTEQTAFFIAPGLCVLYRIAIRSGRTESRILRQQLADEVATGILTPREYAILSSGRLRHLAMPQAFRRGGLRRWTAQQQFFQAAAELALCKNHESHGDPPPPHDFCLPEDDHRARLAALRAALGEEK